MQGSSRFDDVHICPKPGHGRTSIVTGSPDTTVNFRRAVRVGDVCECGAVITTGFPSILINGRPLAYLGSPSSHGGRIVPVGADDFNGFSRVGAIAGGAVILGLSGVAVDFARLGVLHGGGIDEAALRALLIDPDLEHRALSAGALIRAGIGS